MNAQATTAAPRSWSPQQQSIFDYFAEGVPGLHLIVKARAGTGKTTTIVEGIKRAPEANSDTGRPDVFMCAFNRRIAEELNLRTRGLNVEARTFHGKGLQCIQRQWPGTRLDRKRGWNLAEKAAGLSAPEDMIKLIARLAGHGKNCAPDGEIADLKSLAIRFDCVPDCGWEDDGWTLDRVAQCAREAMQLALVRDGTVDFDDQIYIPVAAKFARPEYRLVVIDEAQDCNKTRLKMAIRLCNVRAGGRIVVVGDDRQAIYGFCGAHSSALEDLKIALRAQELPLTVTYRCARAIVETAKVLVPDYTAAPTAPAGEIRAITSAALYDEAQLGDAILSRKNAPLASICLRLLRNGKRARIEGKDIGGSFAKLVESMKAKNWTDFFTRLSAWRQREEHKVQARAKKDQDGVADKLDEIADKYQTIMALSDGVKSVPALLKRIAELFADTEEGSLPAIVCSSIHRAKGLEWRRVFVCDWTLYSRSRNADSREEANLEYVAVTRAIEVLYRVSKALGDSL